MAVCAGWPELIALGVFAVLIGGLLDKVGASVASVRLGVYHPVGRS
jgi:hypothetical protein